MMRAPIRPTIYDAAYWLAFLAAAPYFLYRFLTSRRWRTGFRARLGLLSLPRPKRPPLWVHGVSVGEVLAAKTLVAALRARFPAHEVLVTSTTPEGFRVARKTYPDCLVAYYPIDASFVVGRFFDRLRPAAALLVELEIWPNFLLAARYRKVPVVIVNGRISERSFPRYYRFRRAMAHIFNSASLYGVQTDTYAARLRALGVPAAKVFVTGSLKYETINTAGDPAAGRRRRGELGLSDAQQLLIGGSTHAPEEAHLLAAYRTLVEEFPALRLALVPRHLTRADEVAALIQAAGLRVARRSAPDKNLVSTPLARDTVWLVDTMGELGTLYEAAAVVFVGGSLVPHGGQNMLEPAGLGKPVVFGPHTANFQEAVGKLLEGRGARQVADAAELTAALRALLAAPDEARALGARGRAVVAAQQGATRRTVELLARVLAPAPTRVSS